MLSRLSGPKFPSRYDDFPKSNSRGMVYSRESSPLGLNHQRHNKESDTSNMAHESQSMENDYDIFRPEEQEESESESEDNTEMIKISNSNFVNRGAWFINWNRPFSGPGQPFEGPTVRQVQAFIREKRQLYKKRITSLAKLPGDDFGNMALWVGGTNQLIGLLRDSSRMQVLELDKGGREDYKSFTSQISYLKSYIIFFTSSYNLIVMDLSGTITFMTDIEVVFNRFDYVVSSISQSESGCLVLGTNEGQLIVISVEFSDKYITQGFSGTFFTKRVSSLIWLDEEAKTFLASSYDRTCIVFKFEDKENLLPLRVFRFDQSISCCIPLGKLVLAAFGNGVVSYIEPEQGRVLLSMHSAAKNPHSSNDFAPTNWLGYFYMGDTKEFNEDMERDFAANPEGFLLFASRIRVICKSELSTIHIFGFPQHPANVIEIECFKKPEDSSHNCDSRRLPVLIERFDSSTLVLRVFSIQKNSNHLVKARGGETEDEFATWMTEIEVKLSEQPAPLSGRSKPPVNNHAWNRH